MKKLVERAGRIVPERGPGAEPALAIERQGRFKGRTASGFQTQPLQPALARLDNDVLEQARGNAPAEMIGMGAHRLDLASQRIKLPQCTDTRCLSAPPERPHGDIGLAQPGQVKREEYGNIIVDIGRGEAILRRNEKIGRESYRPNDRIRAYIKDVRREARGPQIFLSRTDPQFMAELFKM